ncbi:MAG: PEP-CTERM sorting domain-containing protein [Gammaproteobacteria bacterium]|nr:PEP-CTERM sorting domain-containing protein [Gammaproteobacteria bacterium]
MINYAKIILVFMVFSQQAHAALISNTDITASTSLVEASYSGNIFSVDEIADGIFKDIASPYGGFVSRVNSGTIRLDLNGGPYDLTSFTLYNDVNLGNQGIKDFRLEFFSDLDYLIGNFTGIGQNGFSVSGPQDYAISALGVSRVDLVVLSSHDSFGIEIREVQFNGSSSNSVPEPSVIALFGLGLVGLGFARRRRNRQS